MSVTIETSHVWWAAPSQLTHAQWREAHAACLDAVLHGAVGIDWAECTQVDSGALALVVAAQRASKHALQHAHAPAQLCQLAALYGVADLLCLSDAASL